MPKKNTHDTTRHDITTTTTTTHTTNKQTQTQTHTRYFGERKSAPGTPGRKNNKIKMRKITSMSGSESIHAFHSIPEMSYSRPMTPVKTTKKNNNNDNNNDDDDSPGKNMRKNSEFRVPSLNDNLSKCDTRKIKNQEDNLQQHKVNFTNDKPLTNNYYYHHQRPDDNKSDESSDFDKDKSKFNRNDSKDFSIKNSMTGRDDDHLNEN
ncbi:conserved hypothetical protein [Pediculus humanus corporis]|uniref:Uncharacterized protein n=1 Tax=Pediculus humanus subsp. corporis TaxID=121224 RepID=E0VKL8_PEDHC|nr:uncharacterized protein Phum_PHUM267480 [Pediculus humanus corporis]EEB13924.1 conserved hypothetical protein [Pediculus humanus corporis]